MSTIYSSDHLSDLDAASCTIDMHKCLYPEDGGIRFLVNVGAYLPEHTASRPTLKISARTLLSARE
jgi:hypothetical protein